MIPVSNTALFPCMRQGISTLSSLCRNVCRRNKDRLFITQPFQTQTSWHKVHAAATSKKLDALKQAFKGAVLDGREESVLVEGYQQDWTNQFISQGKLVLTPRSTEEVSTMVRYCDDNGLKIVAQGGNTNLVGSTVTQTLEEVILSTKKLSSILSYDSKQQVVICEAGVVLDTLNVFLKTQAVSENLMGAAEEHIPSLGSIVPLDLGSSGSCTIGGNIGTNAGGIRYCRFGSLRSNVLGLEVVLPNGEVLNMLKALKKDNTGYNLNQLFIGSEGTLGVITKAALQVKPRLESVNLVLLGLKDFSHVEACVELSKSFLSEILSACEFWDGPAMEMITEPEVAKKLNIANPFNQLFPFYLLIETQGSNNDHDMQKVDRFLKHLMEGGFVLDGVLAQDHSQIASLWSIRENFAVGLREKGGHTFKHDISLPTTGLMIATTNHVKAKLEEASKAGMLDVPFQVVQYGHIFDGNLHLNVWSETYHEQTEKIVEHEAFAFISKHGGSISAEHGIGLLKKKKLHYSRDEQVVNKMKQIKKLFDPKNTLNPGKIFDE